jgi:hypothetical protein
MCGCGKKSTPNRAINYRPTIGPKPVMGGVAAGTSPEMVRALNLQQAATPKTANRLDAERLEMMKRRREAIRAKFNK